MEEPKPEPGNGIVVTGISQIQKTQQLFVDEEKPKETVILAGSAVERERKIGRVAQRSKDVPRCGDQQDDQEPSPDVEPFPSSGAEELTCEKEIDHACRHGKNNANQTFQQQPCAKTCGEQPRP